ncbi:hypothetical protein AVEN_246933-1 [Araneus ventricosus]|uniref:Uncharacterized protein n=1 Tax=Araneus ventricosus TaxID=182803 RepID=A0A4Y2RXN9_ARAVE|nr:hypothetical protein AVEN_246933-1 [Araneus ventricosus]
MCVLIPLRSAFLLTHIASKGLLTCTRSIKDKDLKDMCKEEQFPVLTFEKFPCHTQSVERCVELISEAALKVCEVQQNNTEESEKLSTWLADINRQVSLLNASKVKRTLNCLSNKISYTVRHGHPSEILVSGSLLNVTSHIVHLKENGTENFRNTDESSEPIYRSQGDIRGASRRKSTPKKIYKQNEGIENDSNSFHVESRAKCRTSRDESDWIVFKNG